MFIKQNPRFFRAFSINSRFFRGQPTKLATLLWLIVEIYIFFAPYKESRFFCIGSMKSAIFQRLLLFLCLINEIRDSLLIDEIFNFLWQTDEVHDFFERCIEKMQFLLFIN